MSRLPASDGRARPVRRRRAAAVALTAGVVWLAGNETGCAGGSGTPVPPLALLVPAYVQPSSPAWPRLVAAAGGIRAVIVNPDSGPGPVRSRTFAARYRALQAAGIPILGYVPTDFGHRPLSAVVSDIRRYERWYRTDGYFLDEGAIRASALPYYRRVAAAARGREIVMNPAAVPARGYLGIASTIVTFEGNETAYRAARMPAWTSRLPASRFSDVVYGVARGHLAAVLAIARRRNIGSVYVTDAAGSNPYGRLPSYFRRELALLGSPPAVTRRAASTVGSATVARAP